MAKAEGIRANKGKRDEARERWELDLISHVDLGGV